MGEMGERERDGESGFQFGIESGLGMMMHECFAMNFGHRIRNPTNLQWLFCVSQESLGWG